MNIAVIRHRITKVPLPMFAVDIAPDATNNKQIYNIKYLQSQTIVVEPPHTKRELVQCARCQRYNHTKSYCTRQPRCVKCGGNHWTKDCSKNITTEPTCVLCNGNHPANYKGCTVHKEMQKRKFPPLRPKQMTTFQNHTVEPQSQLTRPVDPLQTYASVTSTNQQAQPRNYPQPSQSPGENQVMEMLTKMLERIDKNMERTDKLIDLLICIMSKNQNGTQN